MASTSRPWWIKLFYPLLRLYFRERASPLRLRWKKRRNFVLIIILLIILFLIAYVVPVYLFGLDNGFDAYSIIWTVKTPNSTPLMQIDERQPAKTFWDLLQLAGIIAIPVVVGLGAARFTAKQEEANREQRKLEQKIATDNQHQAILLNYFDYMSELLLEKKLRQSELGDEVRTIARARTLTVIASLNETRKRNVIEFLYEAGLIGRDKVIISLKGVNLAEVCLDRINLRRANLAGAYLERAFTTSAPI